MTDERLSRDLKEMQDAVHRGAMFVVGNSKDITALQEWQERQNGTLEKIEKHLERIEDRISTLQAEDIACLRLEMAKGKPSWVVLTLITFLTSVTVGAVVFAIKMGAGG